MAHCPPDRIRTRAARQDDSATVFLALILLAVFSSFAGIVDLLGAAKAASNEGKLLYVALAAATILVSWTVTQVTFTLHYAHEYYVFERLSDRDALAFPASSNPDYILFRYFVWGCVTDFRRRYCFKVDQAGRYVARNCVILLQHDNSRVDDQSCCKPSVEGASTPFSSAASRMSRSS